MTPQEAIDFFESFLKLIPANPYKESAECSIIALKKQIPTKITHEATLYKCCTCPNCKNVVDDFIVFQDQKTRVTPSYCKYCGQALDWSDAE